MLSETFIGPDFLYPKLSRPRDTGDEGEGHNHVSLGPCHAP